MIETEERRQEKNSSQAMHGKKHDCACCQADNSKREKIAAHSPLKPSEHLLQSNTLYFRMNILRLVTFDWSDEET